MNIQASVASCTSKEGDSLDPTCTQKSLRHPQTSQQTMGTSLSPKEYEPPLPTTPEGTYSYPSAYKGDGYSANPQMSPEHIPNSSKTLNFTLSSKEALEHVLPNKHAMKADTLYKRC